MSEGYANTAASAQPADCDDTRDGNGEAALDAARTPRPLRAVLQEGRTLRADDLAHAMLGLMREVAALHEAGRVAALTLDGVMELADGQLALADAGGLAPAENLDAIHRVQPHATSALKLVGNYRVTQDEQRGTTIDDLLVLDAEEADVTGPAYLTGLHNWEIALGHHDEITDVFQLGMIAAALACGLDPAVFEDVERFSRNRANLFAIAPRLHPVVASLILEATELNRHDRATDVAELARRLDGWRDQPAALAVERVLSEARGVPGRRAAVLAHLRDRLFDLSRRNRLIHFRPTQGSINFTDASIPIVLRIESVRADSLCTWKGQFAADVLRGKAVPLNQWLRFEDQPQIPSQLDRIIQENRRNRTEYGYSSLRLTVAFLHWHNLKDAPEERISSPLLWLPVDVTRRKGVSDRYAMTCAEPVAEFNPALRHMLRQLYDIELPETVDLSETSVEAVHAAIRAQIHASQPGVRLDLQERPAIRLILQRAVQRVNTFNRRRRSGARQTISAAADFNYARDDYRPLGLALFEKFVKPDPLPQRLAAGGGHRPKREWMVAETESTGYGQARGEGHKYAWEIDCTGVTLANFDYKKMSLVRDYNALIDAPEAQPALDQVFSIEPRPFAEDAPPPIPPAEQWGVVPSDATQDRAVALARTGRSAIIQGPPGTGKSQTITNLIADYAGQGKRVLFVCEKRAALDVVFHRLGQAGIDELATVVQDSQDDKKSFIANLREQYERWGRTADGLDDARAARAQTVAALADHLRQIAAFDAAVGQGGPNGASLRDLVRRAAALPPVPPGMDAATREALPALAQWDAHRDMAVRVLRAVHAVSGTDSLAAHPFARLHGDLLRSEHPLATLQAAVNAAEAQLERLQAVLDDAALPVSGDSSLAQAGALATLAERMTVTGLARLPDLLDPVSQASHALAQRLAGIAALEAQAEAAAQDAGGWHDPLHPADTAAALGVARAKEGTLFAVFSGAWRRLKATVQGRYDFAAHAVEPTVTAALERLAAMHDAQAALEAARGELAATLGTGDIAGLLALRGELAAQAGDGPAGAVAMLARSGRGAAALAQLAGSAPVLRGLNERLAGVLDAAHLLTLDELAELLRDLRESLDDLPDLLPHLTALHAAPPAVAAVLTRLPLPLPAIEALVVDEAIALRERADPDIRRFDIDRLIALSRRAAAARALLRDQNAAAIRATLHRRFRDHVRLSETSLTQLDTAGRQRKKAYAAGRRELEHEFGKTMRFKAIRELAGGDTGQVVGDLKPIWLMSPLSVSDTLPLAPDLFDVVIFDEASQIPTEDAVPALCRARQVVIVGDEMQLPPTSFFAASAADESTEVVAEEDGERIAVVLDADSLLTQAARNLPATLLAWHYRSRSEALISFSNAAFYAGALVTVPDRTRRRAGEGGAPVASDDEDAWAGGADRLLAAPITVHRMADGVYDRRANLPEARYIAGLVRELLTRNTGQSIGIVAFSEAQQSEIEDALERLAATDDAFAAALAREMEREEDGQFVGLFVKNLENVQGDERDIILMSVCYAPGSDGRMAMNFGPINQRGGEKRLNVIFSRAKRHMAIVATIAPEAITNVHNDGARALRSFLAFAGAQSAGALDHAQTVLAALNPDAARTFDSQCPADPVRTAIANALRARGHRVEEHVGSASFRCDLAIHDPAGEGYALGVLLDHAASGAADVEERFVFRPGVLRGFGWRVVDVPVTSWLRAQAMVIERIEAELRRSSWDLADPDPLAGAALLTLAAGTSSDRNAGAEALAPGSENPGASDVVPGPAGMTEYRLVAGASNKFWRVGVAGNDLVVEFGRVGTQGQRVVKSFEDADRAQREAAKLTLEKTRKGYEEAG